MMPDLRNAIASAVLLATVLVSGCDLGEKKPKGPNPYRREWRATGPAGGAISIPASNPTTAPAPEPLLPPGTIGSPVMFVNKDTIVVEEILMPIREELEKAAAALPPAQYVNKAAQTIRREIEREIYVAVVYQEAHKGLAKEEEEQYVKAADAEIQQIVNLRFGGLHAKFEKHLAERGMTVADLREKTKRRYLVHKYLDDRFKPLAAHPRRDELRKYYDAHQAEFTTKPRARMSLVEVRFDATLKKPASAATPAERAEAREAARKKAERAKQELDSGVPFDAVARVYSDGPHSDDDGAWDEFLLDSLRPRYKAVVDALATMSPGQTRGVIEGSDAWFIVRCDDLQPGRTLTFEEAQPKISARILDERYAAMQERYVQDLMRKAVIQKQAEFFQAVMAAIPRPADRRGAVP